MSHTAHQRPALGIMFVLMSCSSLQFGAAFAVTLFPLFGALAISVSRLAVASLVVGSAVWLAARWRARRGGTMPPGALSWSKEQWRAVITFGMAFGLMNGFFYCAIDRIPIGLAVAVEFLGPLALASMLTRRLRDGVWVLCALAGMLVLGYEAAAGKDTDYLGLAFALIAGVFWALYIRSSAKVGALVPGASGLAVAMLIGAAFITPVAAMVPAPQPLWNAVQDPKLILLIFGTAMFASVIPYSAELMALHHLPERVFSVLMSVEPAIAAIAGWALLNQETGPMRWVAICLLMTASVGITLTTTKGGSPKQEDEDEDPVPVPLPE
ncbi:DMT family transporter [Rothia mucilaginosa]|uniref:EamA family transporter n=1 Tax=Rothia mucilaginosa TaxID=43675 RepID=A0A943TA52_9MICC|nr:EamA family transporter [Rothia mucilaginosa]MBS6634202.1 EamA family transporter [Rothia mucilaginosa]